MSQSEIVVFLIQFINVLSNLIFLLILGRIISSWMSMGTMGARGPISQFFYTATEPIMRIVRKLPHRIGMFDLSPIIALLGIDVISYFFILLLQRLI